MVVSASTLDWQRGQDALRDEMGRVTALLRSIREPGTAPVVNGRLELRVDGQLASGVVDMCVPG